MTTVSEGRGPEEMRHASQIADSACPCIGVKKGHAESAFCDACRTSSGRGLLNMHHVTFVIPAYS